MYHIVGVIATIQAEVNELMLNSYIPVLVLLVLSLGLAMLLVVLSFVFGPKRANSRKSEPYECGVTPVGSARERFPVHFFLVAMLFIVFDTETIFLYPWAVIYRSLDKAGMMFFLSEMAVFVAILFVGYFYILSRDVFDWSTMKKSYGPRKIGLSETAIPYSVKQAVTEDE